MTKRKREWKKEESQIHCVRNKIWSWIACTFRLVRIVMHTTQFNLCSPAAFYDDRKILLFFEFSFRLKFIINGVLTFQQKQSCLFISMFCLFKFITQTQFLWFVHRQYIKMRICGFEWFLRLSELKHVMGKIIETIKIINLATSVNRIIELHRMKKKNARMRIRMQEWFLQQFKKYQFEYNHI